MKKYILFFASLLTFAACSYEDESSDITNPIPDMSIDTLTVSTVQKVAFEETLSLAPKVTGGTGAGYEYEWRLGLKTGTLEEYRVLSTEPTLEYVADQKPDVNPYKLWFRVTDVESGVMRGVVYDLYIGGISTNGLAVAYTRDGQTSDIDVVEDDWFTVEYTNGSNPSYRRNIFSKTNGMNFNGVIKKMYDNKNYYNGAQQYFMNVISDHNMGRLAALDYELIAQGQDLFWDPLGSDPYYSDCYFTEMDVAVVNGKTHGRFEEAEDQIGFTKYTTPNKGLFSVNGPVVVVYKSDGYNYNQDLFFDKTNGGFHTIMNHRPNNASMARTYYQASYTAEQFKALYASYVAQGIVTQEWLDNYVTQQAAIGYFTSWPVEMQTFMQAANLKQYDCIASGVNSSGSGSFILRNGNDMQLISIPFYGLYLGADLRDISNAPNIRGAVGFYVCRNQNIIYYATSSKIYAMTLPSAGGIEVKEVYSSSAPITHLWGFEQPRFTTMRMNRKAIIISTYTGSDGCIVTIPIGNIGNGSLDTSSARTYTGFGQISAVCIQD